MTNSDLIFQLVEKYGKTDPGMSERCGVSSNTKYIRLYDDSFWGNNVPEFLAFQKGQRLAGNQYVGFNYFVEGPDSKGRELLRLVINSLLIDQTLCSTKDSEKYEEEVKFVKKLQERCYEQSSTPYHIQQFSQSPEKLNNLEKAERKILDSIKEIVQEKYNGDLEFPIPIILNSMERNSMFVCANSINAKAGLNFYNSIGWSDMITTDRYGKYFLSELNVLLGGKEQIQFHQDNKGRTYISSSLAVTNSDIEKMPQKEALEELLNAEGEINFNYRPYTDYIYKRLYKGEKSKEYILEHEIHSTSFPTPVFKETMTIDQALEFCQKAGIDIVTRLKTACQEDIERTEQRFTKAFKHLMPSLYEQTKKEGVQIDSFDAILKWCHDKEKDKRLDKLQERQDVLAERTGQKTSSPSEPTTHDSNSSTSLSPKGRDDGGR